MEIPDYLANLSTMAITPALMGVLLLCQFSFAQAVKVRVVNGNNGDALPKQAVSVQFLYEKPPKATPPLRIETDANGEAQFRIPEPPPERLDVRLALTSGHWHCGCWVMPLTEDVISKGHRGRHATEQSESVHRSGQHRTRTNRLHCSSVHLF
jgi:hypothetical protein